MHDGCLARVAAAPLVRTPLTVVVRVVDGAVTVRCYAPQKRLLKGAHACVARLRVHELLPSRCCLQHAVPNVRHGVVTLGLQAALRRGLTVRAQATFGDRDGLHCRLVPDAAVARCTFLGAHHILNLFQNNKFAYRKKGTEKKSVKCFDVA